MRKTCFLTFICIATLFGSTPCSGLALFKRAATLNESEANFIKHCNNYESYAAGKSLLKYSINGSCKTLYDDFKNKEFESLWTKSGQSLPKGKTLLWSGTYDAATKASREGTTWVVIGDTLPGYIAQGIGRTGDHLWGGISKKFAESTSGVAQALLGNQSCIIYNKSSAFAMHEVPFLKGIPKLKVYILNGTKENCDYSCKNPRLDNLREDLNKEIKFDKTSKEYCEDDQKVVQAFIDGTLFISRAPNHVSSTSSFVLMSVLVTLTWFWAPNWIDRW